MVTLWTATEGETGERRTGPGVGWIMDIVNIFNIVKAYIIRSCRNNTGREINSVIICERPRNIL